MSSQGLKNIFIGAVLATGLGAAPLGLEEDNALQNLQSAESGVQIIHDICISEKPRLIVDHFSLEKPDYGVQSPYHTIDVDGDGAADMGHGDFIKKVAELSGKKVLTYGLKTDPDSIKDEEVGEDFSAIVSLLREGKIPSVSALSFSIGLPEKITEIDALFYGGEGDSSENIPYITSRNIGDARKAIVAKFKEKAAAGSSYAGTMMWRIQFLEELEKLGIPLITTAGNKYSSSYVNMYAVFGGIPVGALTHDGKEIAPYSNNNSLTKIYRVGDFIGRKVRGGIDINGDDIPEFSDEILSAEPANDKDIKDGSLHWQEEGYSTKKIQSLARIYGDYVGDGRPGFRKKPDGSIAFDPANNGDPSQVSLLKGTSFAAPNICGR